MTWFAFIQARSSRGGDSQFALCFEIVGSNTIKFSFGIRMFWFTGDSISGGRFRV
jgi:hypothetical protein